MDFLYFQFAVNRGIVALFSDIAVVYGLFQLWHAYFSLLVKFITQPCLQLEQFSVNKRQKVTQL